MNQSRILIFAFLLFGITFQSCVERETDLIDQKKLLILQPDARTGVDAVVWTERPDQPIPNSQDFQAMGWTWFANGYDGGIRRSLIDFDLSSIPQNAKIVNATLSLYFNPTSPELPSTFGHSQRDGSNSSTLSRITSDWSEETVTWNTQPSISTDNQIPVKESTTINENYNIDVKNLVEDMVANPLESFGFLYMLDDESFYRAMIFASSDNADSDLHPKLEIEYTLR